MLRKGLMKRLSKSASDISGCKKRTYSTSPDEEEHPFRTPKNLSDDEEGEGVDHLDRSSVDHVNRASVDTASSPSSFLRMLRERFSGGRQQST